MRIEVDQSGKIENYKNTIIGFSNEENYTIEIKRKLKVELFQQYRETKNLLLY